MCESGLGHEANYQVNGLLCFPMLFGWTVYDFYSTISSSRKANIAGKTSNLDDNSPVKEKTPNSSGTPTSTKNGVMLTIQYRTPDGEPSVKFFKTSEAEAYDFITELKEGIPFPTLYCEGEICAFAASKIAEVRVEKTDVSEVSKGQGQKATELGS